MKKHICPNCKKDWQCNAPDECRIPDGEESLCRECDSSKVRERLGGKWNE